jgi:hypothetical protein
MVDVGVGKVPLGPAKSPSRRDGGTGLNGPSFNMMDRLTVPFQPLNAPLSCALLKRRSWTAPGSVLTRRLDRVLVVLGRCSHIMPEAVRGIEMLVI